MAKFMEEVDGTSGLSRTNNVLRSVLSGDSESARQRLTRALEKLGYHVISEDPLYARRGARGSAVYYCSFDILDYPRKLKIGLKALSPNATLATFDYAAEHFAAVSFKGDLQTLKLEAEAIIALASQSAAITVCTACGTNQPDDSRFCRVCGAPNVGGAPAELEVLRLTAGARAAHHKIVAASDMGRGTLDGCIVRNNSPGRESGRTDDRDSVGRDHKPDYLVICTQRFTQDSQAGHVSSSPCFQKVFHRRTLQQLLCPQPPQHRCRSRNMLLKAPPNFLPPKPKEREKELVYRRGRDTSPTG